MVKLNNSDFESLDTIIKSIDFNYVPEKILKMQELEKLWLETTGGKISAMTKISGLSKGILKISCCDSYVANELYIAKDKILEILNEKKQNTEINITDIRFEYK